MQAFALACALVFRCPSLFLRLACTVALPLCLSLMLLSLLGLSPLVLFQTSETLAGLRLWFSFFVPAIWTFLFIKLVGVTPLITSPILAFTMALSRILVYSLRMLLLSFLIGPLRSCGLLSLWLPAVVVPLSVRFRLMTTLSWTLQFLMLTRVCLIFWPRGLLSIRSLWIVHSVEALNASISQCGSDLAFDRSVVDHEPVPFMVPVWIACRQKVSLKRSWICKCCRRERSRLADFWIGADEMVEHGKVVTKTSVRGAKRIADKCDPEPWMGGCKPLADWEKEKRRQRVATLRKHQGKMSTEQETSLLECALSVLEFGIDA